MMAILLVSPASASLVPVMALCLVASVIALVAVISGPVLTWALRSSLRRRLVACGLALLIAGFLLAKPIGRAQMVYACDDTITYLLWWPLSAYYCN